MALPHIMCVAPQKFMTADNALMTAHLMSQSPAAINSLSHLLLDVFHEEACNDIIKEESPH